MKIAILIVSFVLLTLLPIVYALAIYTPDNCERTIHALTTEYETLKTTASQIYNKADQLVKTNVDYASFAHLSTNTALFKCVTLEAQDLLFLEGVRGFSVKQIALAPHEVTRQLFTFKDATANPIGQVSIERIESIESIDTLVLQTKNNSNKVSISNTGGLFGIDKIRELLEKAHASLTNGSAFDETKNFIAQLHVNEIQKPPFDDSTKTIRIRVVVRTFVHEAVAKLNETNLIDFTCAWDAKHGVLWSNDANGLKNTVQTINTANEDVFPVIVTPMSKMICSLCTTKCVASVEKLYNSNLDGNCIIINVPNP